MSKYQRTITIPLRVASKKNSRRNFGKISLPSKAYEKFHSAVAPYLYPHKGLKIDQPFSLTIEYEIKGKYHQDLDNVVSSVLDCLQDYQIITDDDLCTKIWAGKTLNCRDWMCLVSIDTLT